MSHCESKTFNKLPINLEFVEKILKGILYIYLQTQAKIPTLYRDWLRSLKWEKGLLFSCIEGKGGGKDSAYLINNFFR